MIVVTSGSLQANEIHRAANYLYNVQNYFPRLAQSGGIKIIASTSKSSGGYFTGYTTGNPHIVVYASNSDSYNIGTTLHELGHYLHFQKHLNQFEFIHVFFAESFASYIGWHLCEQYYTSIGWTKSSSYTTDITGNDRQFWYRDEHGTFGFHSNHGWYSPLFIDLTDSYNQHESDYVDVPVDVMDGASPTDVWGIISQYTSWEQIRPQIKSIMTRRYSDATVKAYLDNYDYWFDNYGHFDI
jgi:hypothetical protein